MDYWLIVYLLCGVATIYPYYRFAVKPKVNENDKETSWRDLHPIFFPLITVIAWPIALATVAIALYVQRLQRRQQDQF